MTAYTPDSHSLIWYAAAHPALSQTARLALNAAFSGKVKLIIPTIVMLEIFHLCLKKPYLSFKSIIAPLEADNVVLFPLSQELLRFCYQLPKQVEIHDRIIAATAKFANAALITRDPVLAKLPGLKTVW